MANGLTPSLPSGALGWLSKAQVGGTVYAIKDAALRAMLDTAATKEAITTIITKDAGANANNDTIPTTKAMKDWVEEQIQGLIGAMHFAGVTTPDDTKTAAERLAALDPTPEAGDIAIDGTTEYVYDGSNWKELGDEGVYATKGELEDAIADIMIAGVELGDDAEITAQELKTALGLGDFAFVNTGSASYDKVTGVTATFSGATLSLSGNAVSVPQTFSALDVTPAGEVSATASSVDINYDKFKSASVSVPDMTNAQYQDVSSVVITSGSEGTVNYTPAGSVSVNADSAATFNASTTSVATVTDNGTAYSLSGGSVAKDGNDSASAFATEGVTAAMDTTDTEMLVFSAAGTANAIITTAGITYTMPTLSGALPTFGSVDVATGGTISLPSFSGSFSGTGAVLTATANKANASITGVGTTTAALSNVAYDSITVTVPAQGITATFSGTSKSVTPAAAKSADAAPANAQVTLADQVLTGNITYTTTTITVSPVNA